MSSEDELAYLTIDENGEIFLSPEETPLRDLDLRRELLKNLKLTTDFSLVTNQDEKIFIVESFDVPLTAFDIQFDQAQIFLRMDTAGAAGSGAAGAVTDLSFEADPLLWSTDADDVFHGMTTSGAPFKLSSSTQDRLFKECDKSNGGYDDESFTLHGITIRTPSHYSKVLSLRSVATQKKVADLRGELSEEHDEASNAFKDMLPRLKMPKSRILVLGCGNGHDAALFAAVGHVVTVVDNSQEILNRAKSKFSKTPNLYFEKLDLFDLPHDWNQSFDLIIEHGLFSHTLPEKRKQLATIWRRLLHEEGQIMAIFLLYDLTESDLRRLLAPRFQFLFWGRLRNSPQNNLGKELFVLAKKR